MEKRVNKNKIIILAIAILLAILSFSIAIFGIIELNKKDKHSEGATAVNFTLGGKSYTIYYVSSGHKTTYYEDSGCTKLAYINNDDDLFVYSAIGFYYMAYRINSGSFYLSFIVSNQITLTSGSGFTGLGTATQKYTGTISGKDKITNNSGYALIYSIMTEIGSVAELKSFASYVNGGTSYEGLTVKLTNNITFSSSDTFTPIGTSSNPFKGTFDGNYFAIRNLPLCKKTEGDNVYYGLFTCISNATIKNLKIEETRWTDSSKSRYTRAGILVARTTGISYIGNNIFISKDKTNYLEIAGADAMHGNDSLVGGIVGAAEGDLTIENCAVKVDLKINNCRSVGGMIGLIANNSKATINSSYFIGTTNVSAGTEGNSVILFFGGLVGGANKNSWNNGTSGTLIANKNYIEIVDGTIKSNKDWIGPNEQYPVNAHGFYGISNHYTSGTGNKIYLGSNVKISGWNKPLWSGFEQENGLTEWQAGALSSPLIS